MLGAYCKKQRTELNLSVREVADASGLTEAGYYLIERGDRINLRPDTFLNLSRVLKVPVDKLLAKANDSATEVPKEAVT